MTHKLIALGVIVILLLSGVAGATAADINRAPIASVPALVQAILTWEQANSNGFGDPLTWEVSALETFNGYLYAGTYNQYNPAPGQLYDGAQIFRSQNGLTWTSLTDPGFGITHDIAPPAILDLLVFNGYLYASTGRGGSAAQIRRSATGMSWGLAVVIDGFADPDNKDITALAEYNGKIYAGVTNQIAGPQLWSSFTGDSNSWVQVPPPDPDPGTPAASVTGFAVFDGALYGAVEIDGPAQIWQTYGTEWAPVMTDGFGNSNTTMTGGMAVFGSYLYVGAGNTNIGAQLWRTNDGTTWEPVNNPDFGNPNNQKVEMVVVFKDMLYVSIQNAISGIELWRTADGAQWEQINPDGFGDSHNSGTNWSNASAEFLGNFYTGTSNVTDGGELWRIQQQLMYVPLALR